MDSNEEVRNFYYEGSGLINKTITFPARFLLQDLIIQFATTAVSVVNYTRIKLDISYGSSVDWLGTTDTFNTLKVYVGTAQVNMYYPLNVYSWGVNIFHSNAAVLATYTFTFKYRPNGLRGFQKK